MAQVGFATLQVIPSLKGLDRTINSQLFGPLRSAGARAGSDAGTSASRGFARNLSAGITGAASSIGRNASRALAGGLIVGGGLAAVFGKKAIDAASDLNETLSKTKVVLGSAADDVIKWSSTTAKSLGQSQQSALDAAATFGVFGKSAGLTGTKLGGFSKQMVTLTSDMASFSNTTPEEAIEAVSAALRGESEPIRKYGVLLDDATLRTQALKLGLIATTKQALTPQQKVLAAQAEILRQTSDAQGDFARTSDGVANKQRILSAQVDNLKAKLGQGLLPIFSGFLSVANKVVLPAVDKIQVGFKALGAAFSGEGITSTGFVGAMEHIGVAARAGQLGIKALFKSFQDGDVTSDGFVGGMERVGVALRSIVAEAGPRIKAALAAIAPALQSAGAAVGAFVTQHVLPLAQALIAKLLPVVVKIGQSLATLFSKVIIPAITELAPVLGSFVDFVSSKVVPVVAKFGEALAGFIGFLSSHAGAVKTFAKVVLGLLVARFAALKVTQAVSGIRSFIGAIGSASAPALKFARSLFQAGQAVRAMAAAQGISNTRALGRTLVTMFKDSALGAQVMRAKTLLMAGAMKVARAAQAGFNLVMAANPVLLVVAAIVALGVAVFIAYKKFKPFRAVVDAVGRALATVARVVTGALAGAFEWIKSNWPKLLLILTGPIGIAILVFKRFGPAILSGISSAFGAVVGFLTGLPARIVGVLGSFGSLLVNLGGSLIRGLWNGIKAAWSAGFEFFTGLAGRVLRGLGKVGSWLLDAGGKVIGGLWRGIKTVWDREFEFWSKLPGRILRALGAVGSWLFEAGGKVIGGLFRGITGFWSNTLAPWINDLRRKVVGKIGDAAKWLFDKGKAILIGLGDGIVRGTGAVLGWLGGLAGRVIGAIGDAGHWLFDVGKQIIEGLLNGIKDGLGKVKDFLGGVGKKIIGWKGPPAKDAKLLIPTGGFIMSGLVKGIAAELPALQKQLGVVSDQFAKSFARGNLNFGLPKVVGPVKSTPFSPQSMRQTIQHAVDLDTFQRAGATAEGFGNTYILQVDTLNGPEHLRTFVRKEAVEGFRELTRNNAFVRGARVG